MEINEKWLTQAEMLIGRVAKNLKKLVPWSARENLTCYRIYDRDIPEIPIAVDWYDGRLHISVYENLEENVSAKTAEHKHRYNFLAFRLASALNVSDCNVFLKFRIKAEGGGQYSALNNCRKIFSIKENDLTFLVNLSDYVDTGLFLDHRMLRRIVMADSLGKRVLNLFAYTGAFSVYAAAGGALSTTTVDLSNTYLNWARENMRQNGFVGDNHIFIRDDVLGAIVEKRISNMYDLIVLDPPTVSKSKSMHCDLDIQRDHPILLNGLLNQLSPGGTIYFSNNLKSFKFKRELIKCENIEDITKKTLPFDFRSPRVHHSYRLTKELC